jgi:hypothetical protein
MASLLRRLGVRSAPSLFAAPALARAMCRRCLHCLVDDLAIECMRARESHTRCTVCAHQRRPCEEVSLLLDIRFLAASPGLRPARFSAPERPLTGVQIPAEFVAETNHVLESADALVTLVEELEDGGEELSASRHDALPGYITDARDTLARGQRRLLGRLHGTGVTAVATSDTLLLARQVAALEDIALSLRVLVSLPPLSHSRNDC